MPTKTSGADLTFYDRTITAQTAAGTEFLREFAGDKTDGQRLGPLESGSFYMALSHACNSPINVFVANG